MACAKKAMAGCLALIFLVGFLRPDSALSMSINKEKELSKEFKEMALSYFELINEPLIADYVTAVGQRILSVMPPQPFVYRFYVIKENSLNAFAGPGGLIFIHSGLMAIMESEDELAGILSHEISHGTHRHIANRASQWKGVGLAALATVAAGMLLGVTGGGMPAEAVALSALSAGQSVSLAYSREDEMQADKTGLAYLKAAGYSANGLLVILRKMRSQQWFGPQEIPTYLTTHPALDERMAYISSQAEATPDAAEKTYRVNPEDFKWPHTKLVAMFGEERVASRRFEREVKEQPESALAQYGYGLVLARTHNMEKATEHIKLALDRAAFNPHILIDLGRIYYESHQFKDAVKVLKGAVTVSPHNVEGLYFLGRTQYEMGEYGAAKDIFSTISDNYEDVPVAFYHLGQSYGKLGDASKAHYNLGIYYKKIRSFRNALFHFRKAVELAEDPEEKREIEKMIEEIMEARKKQQLTNQFQTELK